MSSARAQATQFDALDRLLLEAGCVAQHWESLVFREHGWREARRLYLPPAEEIGRGKFTVALALRETMAAVHHLRADDARCHAAAALRCLVNALRAEPILPQKTPPVTPARAYWLDRE